MIIKIKDIVKKSKIIKASKGNDIFIAMKSMSLKNPVDMKFQLDFEGMEQISPFVFKQIIVAMQKQLSGDYLLEIINGNPLITQSFKFAIS